MTTINPDRVSMPARWLWLLRLGGPLLGFGLGFLVKPVVAWATSALPGVPGPLRLAAEIPTPWLVPILTVMGAAAGLLLSAQAEHDALTLTVDADSIVTSHRGDERYLARSQIGAIFTDPKDFVVLDPAGREIFRGPAADLSADAIAGTLRRHGYPWRGTTDPHEAEYRRWVDGHPDLDAETNALLRERRRALESKQPAEAEEIHARLQDRGIVVRNRDKAQQYRRLAD